MEFVARKNKTLLEFKTEMKKKIELKVVYAEYAETTFHIMDLYNICAYIFHKMVRKYCLYMSV